MTTDSAGAVALIVRRTIAASPEALFAAWTDAAMLSRWWGPPGVSCISATLDARVGGNYRLVNELADGSEIIIEGTFEKVIPPAQLTFSWRVTPSLHNDSERVDVRFVRLQAGTEIIITHERIPSRPVRDSHENGWRGCLEGLASFIERDFP